MIITLLLLVFLIFLFIINHLLKHTEWYHSQFEDAIKFKNVPSNLEVINLGSNSGKYGFDYSFDGITGMNWAVGPQTIKFDYEILKVFIQQIKEQGSVILTIVPFSSILDKYESKNANNKYYLFLPNEAIPNYSKLNHIKVEINKILPILSVIKNPKLIIHLIRKKTSASTLTNNPMNESELEVDAKRWIENWKKQFNLKNLDAPLVPKYLKIQDNNQQILINMIELCKSKELKPVIVLPPISPHLLKYLTPNIRQIFIYNFLEDVIQKTSVKLLDYTDDIRFADSDLYFNSFFLNQRGRKSFTKIVLKDIQNNN